MIPSVRYWKNDDSAVLRNKPIFSPRGVSASEWILFFRLCFVGVVTRPTQTRFVCLDLLEAVVLRRVDSLVYLDILERLQLERLFFFRVMYVFIQDSRRFSFDHSCQAGR